MLEYKTGKNFEMFYINELAWKLSCHSYSCYSGKSCLLTFELKVLEFVFSCSKRGQLLEAQHTKPVCPMFYVCYAQLVILMFFSGVN